MQITSGKIEGAQKVVIYGPEGIGKSTFAAQFPNPLFIDTEGSTKHLDVRRLPNPESWTMLLNEVTYVVTHTDECSTLIVDSADWAEDLCINHVCAVAQKSGIEDFGYGKGYTYLAEEFGKLLNLLTECVDRGVNVVLTAHAQIRKFEQPDEMAAYDRYELKLQKKTAPLVREWADMVLFANYKTFAVKNEDKKAKAQGGKRVMFTSHHPAWDAKNRVGLAEELDFNFKSIAHVIPAKAASSEARKQEVQPCAAEPAVSTAETAATTTASSPEPERHDDAPKVEMPLASAQLIQLMRSEAVTEDEIRKAVHDAGYYPLETPIDKYADDFVEGVLVGAWPQVLEAIKNARQMSLADVPFK